MRLRENERVIMGEKEREMNGRERVREKERERERERERARERERERETYEKPLTPVLQVIIKAPILFVCFYMQI